MSAPTTLFASLRGRARRGIVIEGLAMLLTALVAFMLISFALDRSLRLEEVYRVSMLVVFLVVAWRLLSRNLFTPMSVDLNDDEMALALERGETDLAQALISAVQFERSIASGTADEAESVELMQTVVDDVQRRVPSLRGSSALDVNRVRKFSTAIVGCLAIILTWGVIDADSLVLWAKRNLFMSGEDWPRATQLAFAMDTENGVIRIAEGNDVTVEVRAGGVIPEQVFINYEFADGTVGKEPMALSGGADSSTETKRFTWLLESIPADVSLYATGGDGLSEEISFKIVKRPMLSGIVLKKTFPAYMKRDPETVSSSVGDIRVPAGVVLDIQGKSDKLLENAFFTYGDQKVDFKLGADNTSFAGTFTPAESGVLTIDVTDRDKLGAGKPPKIFLRVVKDRAPIIDYKTEGIGSMVLYKAMIPGILKIRDDFGLTKIVAKIRITGGKAKRKPDDDDKAKGVDGEQPWETVTAQFQDLRQPDPKDNETDYEQRVVFDFLSRNDINKAPTDPSNPIQPDMLFQIQFEAYDNFGPGEKLIGTSEILTLRVVTEEKLMRDLHRRQIERRRELRQILEKEKNYKAEVAEIISPTSNNPNAGLAKLRLQAIARDQRALGKQMLQLADRYRRILDEYFNNRILKPSQITKQRQGIQHPLEKLSRNDFPDSAQAVEDFSHQGLEDIRTIAVSGYSTIIKVIERVIKNMKHLESVAGILEEVRRIREMETAVRTDAQKSLDKADTGGRKKPPEAGKKTRKTGDGARQPKKPKKGG